MTAVVSPPAARAHAIAGSVTDPELPMLTLVDLGVLRSVRQDGDGSIVVTLTPTYTGCPALTAMRADVHRALTAAGFDKIEVRTCLSPAWSSDWITVEGRRKLEEHGIAAPNPAPVRRRGPVPLALATRRPMAVCPRCGSLDTEELSTFGSTACKSLNRCRSCHEPFERMKEI
jgi:ring-1,2-phenylacetyl-CoA epoxidase subunit PaaD